MEFTELCLAPKHFVNVEKRKSSSSLSESDGNPSTRKRKFSFDHHHQCHHLIESSSNRGPPSVQTSVDLHVKDPLPLDWEQCLDLQSGRMYYLNRKTSSKSWNWPKEHQKLDLELNISSTLQNYLDYPLDHEGSTNNCKTTASSSSTSNMVALACLNCHLLVILSMSSPSCPNCKYVHSLPALQSSQPKMVSPAKPQMNTLRLLN